MNFDSIPLDARREYSGQRYAACSRTERELIERQTEAFGLLDSKGREIGHAYTITREFWVVDADSHLIIRVEDLDDRLEETFLVEPHALRDGQAFGAMPVASYKRFRTIDEARKYGHLVFDRAYKRALKKAQASA